jgi:hypothetical protein
VLSLDHFKSANTAADVHARPLRVVRIHPQAGLSYRKLGGRDAELNEAAHLLDLFALDVPAGIEILDFAGNAAVEIRGVELFDSRDPVPALAQTLPSLPGANAERAHQTDSRHYYSARRRHNARSSPVAYN